MSTSASASRLHRWSAPASLVAGVLWLLVWSHQRTAHGLTTANEMRVVLGLTWMDSGKLLVVPPLLLILAMVSLHRRRERPSGLGRAGAIVTFAGLGSLGLGIALEFWPFPWGSYALRFEDAALPRTGGLIQSLSSLVLTLGFVVFGIDLVRARVMPAWAVPTLAVGGLTTFFLTPASWLPGLCWLLLGLMLSRRSVPAAPG